MKWSILLHHRDALGTSDRSSVRRRLNATGTPEDVGQHALALKSKGHQSPLGVDILHAVTRLRSLPRAGRDTRRLHHGGWSLNLMGLVGDVEHLDGASLRGLDDVAYTSSRPLRLAASGQEMRTGPQGLT